MSVVWIDYTKAYDMAPHTWILQWIKIFKVANNIRSVIEKSLENWKVELTSGRETLCEVKINRDIFQGDSLSLIMFVITLIPLSLLLRDMKADYMLKESSGKRITYSLWMI